MASYREFMNDYLANCKCRGKLKAKSDAEVLVTKLCEKLDEMGGGGIKTVVIKGVKDETTSKMVYTPNMTYEEVRDMMLNLEPFNTIWIEGYPIYGLSIVLVKYDSNNNRIVLTVSNGSSSGILYWTAAGIFPMPM